MFKLSGMWNMWWLWWLCGGCDVARGGGNMRNLTIIDEKSCNISLEKNIFITPVINLLIFLSNHSKLFSTYGVLLSVPDLYQITGTSGTYMKCTSFSGTFMIGINF